MRGAGIFTRGTTLTLKKTNFTRNSSNFQGGAIYMGSEVTNILIEDCIFRVRLSVSCTITYVLNCSDCPLCDQNNDAGENGGGMTALTASVPTLISRFRYSSIERANC